MGKVWAVEGSPVGARGEDCLQLGNIFRVLQSELQRATTQLYYLALQRLPRPASLLPLQSFNFWPEKSS